MEYFKISITFTYKGKSKKSNYINFINRYLKESIWYKKGQSLILQRTYKFAYFMCIFGLRFGWQPKEGAIYKSHDSIHKMIVGQKDYAKTRVTKRTVKIIMS